MLAYVFSHRAAPGTDLIAYEAGLRLFHAALEEARPAGFISSNTYRYGAGYSDWYLIEDSAALDTLNRAAVSGARSRPHDDLARSALDGSGKLLSLVSGRPAVAGGFELGFNKPPSLSYADLDRRLEPWTEQSEVSLWRRMMVLGPAPEFCLISPSEVQLPADLHQETRRRDPI